MFQSFSIVFISIILEAVPFVLIGTLFSGIIEVFVPNEWVSNRINSGDKRFYLMAGLLGIIFPVCECAIVPIMRRLVKKGVPVGVAVTFMLAAPIVNPVVLLSTFYAFSSTLKMVILRGVFGYIGAIVIGMLITKYNSKDIMKEEIGCACHHHHGIKVARGRFPKIEELIEHTSNDFLDVFKYLIIGAFIATALQTFVPKSFFLLLNQNVAVSIVVMMLLGFTLSLCSEADAFIASSFRSVFPDASLLAFLIFGPMIDIKNTLMLMQSFKTKFILKLIGIISAVCFILAMIAVWVGV
jgi:uncharacterized membrane protein YraQ (UPF0718 family)